jgi:hypothetical protein
MITRIDIQISEHDPYYKMYLDLVDPDLSMFEILENSFTKSIQFIEELPKDLTYAYAQGKWSIGEVLQHNIDTERVFQYRALRFLRGDKTDLVGFDQDLFSLNVKNYAFAKAQLIQSLKATRHATIAIYEEASEEQMAFMGTANGSKMSARVFPFLIAGHHQHHESIITERYL